MGFAEAGSRVKSTGGPYAYVEIAFGPYVGFCIGVLLWLLGTTAMAAVADVYASNFARLVPVFEGTAGRLLLLLGTFGFLTAVNIRGAKQGSRVIGIASVLKLTPLLLLLAFGLGQLEPAKLAWPAEAPSTTDITRASIVLFFAYSGIETAMVPGGELKDPACTVPRAVILAMLFIVVLYIALQLVAQGVLGDALVGSPTPLADAAAVVMGPWGRTLLLAAVVVSTFGYLSGMTLAVPRALYAFARDGFLPRSVAKIHPVFRTPWVALLVQTTAVGLLAASNEFESLAVISNVAALLVYAACSLAAIQLRRRDVRLDKAPFTVPGGPTVHILSCLGIIFLLSSVTPKEWAVLVAVLGIGTAIFLATAKARRARALGPVPEAA
jgi:amino acid transporter